jgi:hypothetical protein
MITAIIPKYFYDVTFPVTAVYEFKVDSNKITSDSSLTVDSSFESFIKYSAIIPSFYFNFVLQDSPFNLTSDNTYLTSDNLITSDNG